MIVRTFVLSILPNCLSPTGATSAEAISSFWPETAGAEIILVGTASVPVDEIRADISAGTPSYIEVPISIDVLLKGALPTTGVVQHFTSDAPYTVSNEALIALNGRSAIFFLVRGPGGFYFPNIGSSALQIATTSLIIELSDEIARQNSVAEDWVQHPNSPYRREVQTLLEALLTQETQNMAVQELDALAPEAMISLIDLMDDRRRLPALSRITLSNGPGSFEAYATYGPDAVVDICVGILNHQARNLRETFFAALVNGGSDQTRQLAVNAWRVYGDVLLNHPEELTLRDQ